jgi:hypothetical protein
MAVDQEQKVRPEVPGDQNAPGAEFVGVEALRRVTDDAQGEEVEGLPHGVHSEALQVVPGHHRGRRRCHRVGLSRLGCSADDGLAEQPLEIGRIGTVGARGGRGDHHRDEGEQLEGPGLHS